MLVAGSRYISVQGVAANDPIREELSRHGTVDGRWPSDSVAREIVLGAGLVRSAGLRLETQCGSCCQRSTKEFATKVGTV